MTRARYQFEDRGWVWEWDGTDQTIPVRVRPVTIDAPPGSRWVTLPDAAALTGFHVADIRIAQIRGRIRFASFARSTPELCVLYEDVLSWGDSTGAKRLDPSHEDEDNQPFVRYGFAPSPEALFEKIVRRKKHASEKKKHSRRRSKCKRP